MTDAKMSWEDAVRWCMSEPSMAELARDAYFDEPAEAARRYCESNEFAAIRKVLPATPGRALDLGAGNGILAYALATEGWQVTAVEPDPSDLVGAGAIRTLAADKKLSIEVIEAFGEAIPLSEANFDLVVARQVLHHAADLPAFCREMHRLARPGATILTLRDHVISDPGQLEAFFERHPLHHLYGGENAFTLEQYRSAIRDAGLSIEDEMRSFQSVINYDPMTPETIRAKFGMAAPALRLLPFKRLAQILAHFDKRPGRLVSYLARKPAE